MAPWLLKPRFSQGRHSIDHQKLEKSLGSRTRIGQGRVMKIKNQKKGENHDEPNRKPVGRN